MLAIEYQCSFSNVVSKQNHGTKRLGNSPSNDQGSHKSSRHSTVGLPLPIKCTDNLFGRFLTFNHSLKDLLYIILAVLDPIGEYGHTTVGFENLNNNGLGRIGEIDLVAMSHDLSNHVDDRHAIKGLVET